MKTEMDKFSQLVEKKLNDFEVPFEPAHWSEMSQKLDQVVISNPSNSLLKNKWIWAGAAAILIVGTWIILSENTTKLESDLPEKEQSQTLENSISETSTQESQNETSDEQRSVTNTIKEVDNEPDDVISDKKVDNKLDKYKNINEQAVQSQSQDFVNEKVQSHKSEMPSSPKIDNPELKTDFTVKNTVVCEGDEIEFTVDRQIENAEYAWDFGDKGLTSRKLNPTHKFKKAGRYTILLMVSKGEKNNFKVEKEIIVHSKPVVSFEDKKNLISLNNPYAEFEASSKENCEFKWTFNEINHATGRNVDFLVPDKGFYPIELAAISENGCITKEYYTYQADKGVKMFVEEILTANNDGVNDGFLPKELTVSDVDFIFIVSDLNGKVIFESRDKYTPWNGRVNNSGSLVKQGTYIWKVSFKDDRGKVHKQEGKITLIQ